MSDWDDFIETRDPGARERLISQHVGLVRHIAARVGAGLPSHVDRDDLVSDGYFGLIESVDKFDPARGVPFEAYASRRIWGAILDGVRKADWAPRSVRAVNRLIDQAVEELAASLDRQPTVAELADHLGLDERVVAAARADAHDARTESLQIGADPESGGTDMGERAVVDHGTSDHSVHVETDRTRRLIAEATARLDEPYRTLIAIRYGERLSLPEVGQRLGVGRGKATRLYVEACMLLREQLALLV